MYCAGASTVCPKEESENGRVKTGEQCLGIKNVAPSPMEETANTELTALEPDSEAPSPTKETAGAVLTAREPDSVKSEISDVCSDEQPLIGTHKK